MDEVPGFEKLSVGAGEVSAEQIKKADEWSAAMNDAPEFIGNQFGGTQGEVGTSKYTEGSEGETESDTGEQYDSEIANASSLINYGLNEAARMLGVETVVQKIKSFDASGREDPIGDLYKYLGIDTPIQRQELQQENDASKTSETEFREGVNAPSTNKSVEGAINAIESMKRLISEVEGADSRFEELREGAKASGKGYFEYAVSSFGAPGLTDLFMVLSTQKERTDNKEETTGNEENDIEEKVEQVETESAEVGDIETEDVRMGYAETGNAGMESAEAESVEMRELKRKLQNGERLNPEILEKE